MTKIKMKYSPQQYASALYEAVKGKTAEESVTVLNNFSALLKKNRDTALTRKIAEAFERYAHKKERIISGELVSAREMDGRLKSDVVRKMAEKTNELSKQTNNPEAAKEFYDLWVKMYEKAFDGFFEDMPLAGPMKEMMEPVKIMAKIYADTFASMSKMWGSRV